MSKILLFLLTTTVILSSCNVPDTRVQSSYLEDDDAPSKLDSYWYEGKAEVSSYQLIQNRYRDQHPGEVVLVFVTEDFLTDKQVKNDRYTNPNSAGILKTNKIKRFTTGIYDYSIMTSVFTPTDRKKYPNSLKATCASQDWCGQSFQQLNLKKNEYQSTLHSYFEEEADKIASEDVAILEDELMNLIRMNPDLLPIGKFDMIPSLEYLRLRHKPFKAVSASGNLEKYSGGEWTGSDLMSYRVTILGEKKEVEIVFENNVPYKIEGWKISYPSAFDGEMRETIARKKGEKYIPYWQQNSAKDAEARSELNMLF